MHSWRCLMVDVHRSMWFLDVLTWETYKIESSNIVRGWFSNHCGIIRHRFDLCANFMQYLMIYNAIASLACFDLTRRMQSVYTMEIFNDMALLGLSHRILTQRREGITTNTVKLKKLNRWVRVDLDRILSTLLSEHQWCPERHQFWFKSRDLDWNLDFRLHSLSSWTNKRHFMLMVFSTSFPVNKAFEFHCLSLFVDWRNWSRPCFV